MNMFLDQKYWATPKLEVKKADINYKQPFKSEKGEILVNGLKYAEIVLFLLCHHNIILSIHHLKRILRSLNLRRRPYHYPSVHDVMDIVTEEMKVSWECVGYRTMWKRPIKDHGLAVKRTEVMQIMKHICPNATEKRKAYRLKRRVYTLKGPNYVWHVDGYDKLKPFVYCIHGCIDGSCGLK